MWIGFSNRRTPKLKPGVVPTIEASGITCEEQSNPCNEENTPMVTDPIAIEVEQEYTPMPTEIDEDNLKLHIKTLETKMYVNFVKVYKYLYKM